MGEYLKLRHPKTKEFPLYRVRIGRGEDEEEHFAHSEEELKVLCEEAEKRLGGQLEIFTTPAGDDVRRKETGGVRWAELHAAPALAKLMAELEKRGYGTDDLLGGEKPLFYLQEGENGNGKKPVLSLGGLLNQIREIGRKGLVIQRYKGLGEMNPAQLWETTLNPQNRRLLKVMLEDVVRADQIFTVLMGDAVEPRRQFIEENALNVRNLDI